ncbi:MAG TPA: O-antigen ligase family protein [Planctomycetota bacterium]|nr:O-antigen ligase family protein [Planctomycetota bacterium]
MQEQSSKLETQQNGDKTIGQMPTYDDRSSRPHVIDRTSVRVLDGMIELLAILLIAFTPLAFGATERWSKLVVQISVSGMCALWCFRAIVRRKLVCVKTPLNLLIAAFIILACLQLVPLPDVLASRVSPATVYSQTGTLPGAVPPALDAPPAAPMPPSEESRCISANRSVGQSTLFMVATYAIAFIVVINTIRRRSQVSRLLTAIVVTGFVVAMLGVLGAAAPNGKMLWFRSAPPGALFFGPFVSRNHFAGYLVMVVPIALGMMIATRNRDKKILLGFAASLMAAAVLTSASRGGVISLAAGSTAFALMMLASKAAKKNVFPFVAVLCLAVIGAAVIGISPLLSRSAGLLTDSSQEYRWDVWKDTFRMIAAFPLFGVGLGCFRYVFPMYKSLPVQLTFTHVENDYLQLIVEMGLVGFAIAIAFVALLCRHGIGSLSRKRSLYSRGLIIGLMAAAAGVLVHSLVDFNLHVPSNGLLFALVLGIVAVLGSMHVSRSQSSARVEWIGSPGQRILRGETVIGSGTMGAFSISMACLCVLAFWVAGGAKSCVAEKELDSVERQALAFAGGEGNLDAVDGVRKVQAALKKDGQNPEWRFRAGIFYQTLAQIKQRDADSTPAGAHYLYKLSINEFRKACALDRFNGWYRSSMAIALSEYGDRAAAESAFREAILLDPTNAWVHRKFGMATWDTDRNLARQVLRRAFDLDPQYTRTVLTELAAKTDDIGELRYCISEQIEPQFEYAKFLINNGITDESENVLTDLLARVENDASHRDTAATIFFELGHIRRDRGFSQDAMACFVKAVLLQPDRFSYYEELGYECLRQKRYVDAKKYFEQRMRMNAEKDPNVLLALAEVYENTGPSATASHYYRRALELIPPAWNVSRSKAEQGLERTSLK